MFFALACGFAGLVFAPASHWLAGQEAPFGEAPFGTEHSEDGVFDSDGNLEQPIVDVRIEGNATIPASAIGKYIKSQINRPPVPKQVREDVRSLYKTRWFISVEPRFRQTERGLVLFFRVKERPMVRKIEYRGNKKLKTKVLTGITGLKVGSPFQVAANRESARRMESRYHEKGYTFAQVKLLKGGSRDDRDVIFDIYEGPKVRVTKVSFTGNEFVGDGVLANKIATKTAWFHLIGGRYDPAKIPDDIMALKQYYTSLGFFDVKVKENVMFSEDKSNVHMNYVLNEGPRFKVRNVVFKGNRVIETGKLKADSEMLAGQFFNSRFLNRDIERMKDLYGVQGRVFAKVEAVPRFLEKTGELDLVIEVDEDRVYYIRDVNVHVAGDHPHTRETAIINRTFIHPGDPANSKKIERSRRRLEGSQIVERGPQMGPRVNITPVGLAEKENDSIFRGQSLSVTAGFSGPSRQSNFAPSHARHIDAISQIGHSVQVDGAAQSALSDTESAVLRETRGYRFRSPKLDAFEKEVLNHRVDQIFDERKQTTFRAQGPAFEPGNPVFDNSPHGDPLGRSKRTPPQELWEDQQPGWIDLDWYVNEARTGRLMFGVGVNSDAGVIGNIVLDERNFDLFKPPTSWADFVEGTAFRGDGQTFRMEAVPGNIVSRYLISWTNPYVLDSDYSLTLSGFYFTRFYQDWDENRAGGRVGVGRQLTDEWSANFTLRAESIELSNPKLPTPQLLTDALGSSKLYSGRASLMHDTRDSTFLPSYGHNVQVSAEQAFGDFDFPRFEVEGRQYFTLHSRADGEGRHTLSIGGQIAWTGDDTPIFERLYAGGFQTFRGFEFRGISPRQLGVRVGGRWMAVGSAEYRMPITADDNIAAVLFSDFGTVENDVGFDSMRVTVGAGLRLTVPAMGPVPLAFDFGFPLVKENFDDTQIFSFYIGLFR
ncbi:MAG: BamA/TamA family outer membrane protein [Planctomycetota bacterium]|nr:BamA/TamA family outer membrane protein [Planctomycetota bacterium]